MPSVEVDTPQHCHCCPKTDQKLSLCFIRLRTHDKYQRPRHHIFFSIDEETPSIQFSLQHRRVDFVLLIEKSKLCRVLEQLTCGSSRSRARS